MTELKALVFDCDGVLAETEKDGHRVSFNRAFKEEGLQVEWGLEEYGELLEVAGGKERMKFYFTNLDKKDISDEFITKLHRTKTTIFMEMCNKGELPIRPGIKRLIQEARDCGLMLSVCSTSNYNSVVALMNAILGNQFFSYFEGNIFAGDIVNSKKPSPDIYNLMKTKLKLKGEECCVIEDNENGLLAAKGAGVNCIVTVSYYSVGEDFRNADLVVSSLGDPGTPKINIYKENASLGEEHISFITLKHLKQIASG